MSDQAAAIPRHDPLAYAMPATMRRMWWLFLVLGIAWLLVSLVLLRFNLSSVRSVGILAGIVFLTWGIEELGLGLAMGSVVMSAWRWLHIIFGLLLIAGGIVAIVNPVDTFVALASLVGWILLFNGIFNIVLALTNRDVELWWLRLVLGIVAIALAAIVSGNFVQKAIFLIAFVAAGAMIRGVTNITMAFQLRSARE